MTRAGIPTLSRHSGEIRGLRVGYGFQPGRKARMLVIAVKVDKRLSRFMSSMAISSLNKWAYRKHNPPIRARASRSVWIIWSWYSLVFLFDSVLAVEI